jgi:SAM-dependent methyltransferase
MTVGDATEANIALWDSLFASRAWGRYPPEELVRFIARTFKDTAGRRRMRALEVGCGPGANLWYLAREGFAIAGIDGSKHAIATAEERLRTERAFDSGRPPDLRVGNFATLPWGNATFDVVIDIGAVTSNTTAVIRSAISEVVRVLKPGGWYFGRMFGPKTTGTNTGKMLEERTTENPTEGPLKGIGIIHVFTEQEIRHEFGGFSELQLDWIHRSDRNQSCNYFDWLVQARK